ncbi:DUF6265 family protein [Pedobacter gandavensis]|uniref:DUF6265 domain-containing protein n=1 Tax=Pedobacter gandavensis TaxID=2679963 RepID=A0ABR6EV41_9SPHI|nr:DUF6265 family protein [Pedobacter gandavensis]MBB2149138.1 hypothetical protein [Pedobacter gandavensis]
MRKLKTLLMMSAFLFINTVYGQDSNPEKLKQLEWLTGKWIRTNSKTGQSGYETWKKDARSNLIGKGVTLKGKETLFEEIMTFSFKEKALYFVVSVSGEKQPTYFKLTELGPDGFTCENPKHDFPKKITYKRNGKNLKAVISGDGKSVDYDFIKDSK